MKLTGNTILITGGGSGIGRGLAESFHKLGNKVIIAGRRQAVLDDVVAANPGIDAIRADVGSLDGVAALAEAVLRDYPGLNAVFTVAGISKPEDLKHPQTDLTIALETIATNLIAPMALNAALTPALLEQTSATIMTVSSGLAFVPLALAPTYCATKAAIHSYTESLRYQLKDTPISVIELIPPYVQTELGGSRQAADPAAMPLAEYIAEVMHIMKSRPEATEITVERCNPLRYAGEGGTQKYDGFFSAFNDGFAAAHAGT